jgi:ubiquinone/menaquinone biosynthesis C-methylase UbiE
MKENLAVRAHGNLIMGRRIRQISRSISNLIPQNVVSVLDVGAGTGEMAQAINRLRPNLEIFGADVYIRPKTAIPVLKYDGNKLPFEDASFDAAIMVDVLHHCKDPVSVLKECARITKKWVVIKDHIADSTYDRKKLMFMDWVGNRAHGVVLHYNYLSSSEWNTAFNKTKLKIVTKKDVLNLYPMPFDIVFGRALHCLYLLMKV